jgi:hypothetical protein
VADHVVPPNDPDRQRWKLSSSAVIAIQSDTFTISNAAFPGKVLQPAGNSKNSGVGVVLGDPASVSVVTQVRNPWQVSSPLLGSVGSVLHQ